MAGKGPPKTPTRILKLRGSNLANEREGEPEPDAGDLRCPSWLSNQARRKWMELAPRLKSNGLFTELDQEALERYCYLWSEWRACVQAIRRKGRVCRSKGMERIRPEAKLALEYEVRLARIEQHFGLSPAARASVKIAPKRGQIKGKGRFFQSG